MGRLLWIFTKLQSDLYRATHHTANGSCFLVTVEMDSSDGKESAYVAWVSEWRINVEIVRDGSNVSDKDFVLIVFPQVAGRAKQFRGFRPR